MARRNRLESLQRLAEFAEAESSRHLAERLRALDGEERRLAQIRTYLAEYAGQAGRDRRPMTLEELRGRRGFVERLRDAADAQQTLAERKRLEAEQQTARWRQARSRNLALQRFGERLEERERERQARREQARLDEIGLRPRGNGGS